MKLRPFLFFSISVTLLITGALLYFAPKQSASPVETVQFQQEPTIDLKKGNTPVTDPAPLKEEILSENQGTYQLLFYNVENLFDTLDDPHKNDNEFLPGSSKNWNSEKYRQRLMQLSTVLSEAFSDELPEVIGLAEVENIQVVRDLFSTGSLSQTEWEIFLPESKDQRGIDVAIVYQKNRFRKTRPFFREVDFPENPHSETRNICGMEFTTPSNVKFHFLVNHWPSRLGGEEKSVPKRIRTAEVLRSMVDSLQKASNEFIIITGDFNDTPADSSMAKILKAKEEDSPKKNELINLSYADFLSEKGTSTYKGKWIMLDQFIVSDPLLQENSRLKSEEKTRIIQNEKMVYKKGKKTLVRRAWQGKEFDKEGFSDHLPVGIELSEN